jgi:hypothetical protein
VDEIIQDDRRVTVDTIARTHGIGHNAVQEMTECLGYFTEGVFSNPRTVEEMCTKKWRLRGKIKKGL